MHARSGSPPDNSHLTSNNQVCTLGVKGKRLYIICVILRSDKESVPTIPTIQFVIACSMQKQRGKAWCILSREWRQCLPR